MLDQDFFDNPLFLTAELSKDQSYVPFFFYAMGRDETAKKWMDRAVSQLRVKTLESVPILHKYEAAVIMAYHDFYEMIQQESTNPELETLYTKILETPSVCVAETLEIMKKVKQSTQFFSRVFENRKSDLEFDAIKESIHQENLQKTPSPQKKKKKSPPRADAKVDVTVDVKTPDSASVGERKVTKDTPQEKGKYIHELLEKKTPESLMEALVLNHITPTMFDEEVDGLKNQTIAELSHLSPLKRRELFIAAKNMENPRIKSVFDDAFIDALFPLPITVNFPEYTLDVEERGIFVRGEWYPVRAYDPCSKLYEHIFEIKEGDRGVVWNVNDNGKNKKIFYPLPPKI